MDKPVAIMAGEPVQKMHELDHIPEVGNMVLVPREPTPEMIEAGRRPAEDDGPAACYKAMLSAAPHPPLEGEVEKSAKALDGLAGHFEAACHVGDAYMIEENAADAAHLRTAIALLQSLSADNARLSASVEQAFRDGLAYGGNVRNPDPDLAWGHSRAKAALDTQGGGNG